MKLVQSMMIEMDPARFRVRLLQSTIRLWRWELFATWKRCTESNNSMRTRNIRAVRQRRPVPLPNDAKMTVLQTRTWLNNMNNINNMNIDDLIKSPTSKLN